MDVEANKVEQKSIAAEILNLWDCCTDSGEFDQYQEQDLISLGHRLAELVEAFHNFTKGN